MVIQAKNEDLKKENMELKAKLLQVTKEKEDLASKSVVEVSTSTSHQIVTTKFSKSIAHVSLKEKEISHLVQEKIQLDKSNKKLIEEKDKLIESLQKKLNGSIFYHPQTKEIMVIQAKNEDLKEENMELKAKLLQVTKEKEDFANKSVVEVSASTSHQIDTA